MRKRALKLCGEHWKMTLLVALSAALVVLIRLAVSGLLNTTSLAGIPFLSMLMTTVSTTAITILFYPLVVGQAYILLNLWQCTPANASQLFIFFRNPALRNQIWTMAAIVVLIQNGISLVNGLLAELLGSSGLWDILLVPVTIAFIWVTTFVSMRFFMVPLLFLADPSVSAPQCPRASYRLMCGHCLKAFGFMLVTLLYLMPLIIVFSFILVILGTVAMAPGLAAGQTLAISDSFIMFMIVNLFVALLYPFLILCSTAFCIERVMGHPRPAPANRFQSNL